MKKLLTILFLISTAYGQTTYYIDTTGSDSNNGTSTGTPWKTIAKVNGSTFSAGDRILFKRGQTWRETLTPPSSGAYGNHIYFDAYGTGVKPKIFATETVGTWTSENIGGTDFLTTNTPMSYWHFEDAASTSLDETASNNDLTWSGNAARTTTHKVDTYAFNPGSITGGGSLAFASVSATFPGKGATTDFTVGFWCKLKTSWGIYTNLFGLSNNSSQGWYFSTNFDNKLRFRVYGSSDRTLTSDATMLDGNWHHVVGRWKGSTDDNVSLWVDGIKQGGELPITSLDLVTASPLAIARGDMDAIDEAFVYNTALSDADIKSIFKHGLAGNLDSTTVYYNGESINANNPFTVIRDTSLLNNVDGLGSLEANCWWYDSTNDRSYVFDNPSGHTIEIGKRNSAITTNSKNYLTFNNFQLEGGNSRSGTIRIVSSHHISIDSNEIRNCYTGINNASGGDTVIIGAHNHIHRGYAFGYVSFNLTAAKGGRIQGEYDDWGNLLAAQVIGTDNSCAIFAYQHQPIIENFYIHNIAINYYVLKQGIYLSHSPHTIIRNGFVKDCGHSAVKISSGSDSTDVYNVVSYHCSLGINVVGSKGVRVYNSVFTGADNLSRVGFNGYGISVWQDESDPTHESSITYLKNNIIHNNYWTGAPIRQIFVVDAAVCSISGSDYNIIWSDLLNSGVQVEYKDVGYTYAQWVALGQDTHSQNVNPLMKSNTSDWTLQYNSPAIDAGVNVGLQYNSTAPDIGYNEFLRTKDYIFKRIKFY